jgi:ring-1,2-phenylacetyl-CoA epoxidase subunit PaaD
VVSVAVGGASRAATAVGAGPVRPDPSQSFSPIPAAVIEAALDEVADPEIPVISIVDLGLVARAEATAVAIEVDLLPTFVGCPALEMIQSAVETRLAAFGRPTRVRFVYDPPWTSDRISPDGRAALAEAGFAPPPGNRPVLAGSRALPVLAMDVPVPCPYCGEPATTLESAFGPTQCRTIRHCPSCRQPFEAFKTI